MIIKFGPTIVGARGTLGGITFSANGTGPYAKAWQRPPKTRTSLQAASGNTMIEVSQEWKTISAAQRAAWDTWASTTAPARFNSLGVAITLSGFQWYVEMNTKRLNFGQTTSPAAPVLAEPAAPTISSLNPRETGTGVFSIGIVGAEWAGFRGAIRLAQGATEGQQSFARPNYYFIPEQTPPANNFTITAEVEAIWGLVQLNRSWFLKLAKVNNEGLEGPPAQLSSPTI